MWIYHCINKAGFKYGCAFGLEACFLLCGVLSAVAASCCYNHNLNLYTCNMLHFETELCFVTVLMKIYIFFEMLWLTLICKELALLACRLSIVYPILTHTTPTSFDSSVSDFQWNAALIIFFVSPKLWSCCLSWSQHLAHWWMQPGVSWSGIRIQGQASSNIYV